MMFLSVRNLPNLISAFRLTVSPIMLFLPEDQVRWLFSLLALSDALDGLLARALKAQSKMGMILDPIADKVMLFFALLVCVFKLDTLPTIMLYLLLLRDVSIVLGSFLIVKTKGYVPSPSLLGKLTTTLLSITIVVSLFGYPFKPLVILSLLLIILSWVHYTVKGIRLLSK